MSYCLNPGCHQPQNFRDDLVCQSCYENLLLGNRYRALELIGQGGFGRTFLGVDEYKPSQPYCVIKQFYVRQDANYLEKATELFKQEAIRLEELGKHPQIPELLAYFTQNNRQYLIQEYIQGYNLEQILSRVSYFSSSQIWQLLKSLLTVLKFVHDRQVIHRDIKPENIILRNDGRLFLVDFGAAKRVTETVLGKTGTKIGTCGYSSPEQAIGKVKFASDLYSLGVTCIHLLTGVEPLELYDLEQGDWNWKQFVRDSIEDELAIILDRTIERASRKRYQSAEEILTEIPEVWDGILVFKFDRFDKIDTNIQASPSIISHLEINLPAIEVANFKYFDRSEISYLNNIDINYFIFDKQGSNIPQSSLDAVFYLHDLAGEPEDGKELEAIICQYTKLISVQCFGVLNVELSAKIFEDFNDMSLVIYNTMSSIMTLADKLHLTQYGIIGLGWGGFNACVTALKDIRCQKALLLDTSPDIRQILADLRTLLDTKTIDRAIEAVTEAKFGISNETSIWQSIDPWLQNTNDNLQMLICDRSTSNTQRQEILDCFISCCRENGLLGIQSESIATQEYITQGKIPLNLYWRILSDFFFTKNYDLTCLGDRDFD
jgi:serine/threonine protein kinase